MSRIERDHEGVLPFDPRDYGPFDVAGAAGAWVAKRDRELLALGGVLVVVLIALNATVGLNISIPSWVWIFVATFALAAAVALYPVRKVIEALWADESVPLVVLDPADGDIGIIELSRARYRDMIVVDHDGEEHDASFLHEVQLLSGRRAYEVDAYDAEQNRAVASWMAGATNWEIRRHKHGVRYLKQELSQEADKSLDALTNAPEVLREQGSVVANQMIRQAEGVSVPGDESSDVHEQMWQVVQEADNSEDLLEDRGMSGDSLADALDEFGAGDATETTGLLNNGQEASGDD